MMMNERYNGEPIAMTFKGMDNNIYTVAVEEGTGDNLLLEDMDNGYIDYVNWTMHAMKMDYNLPVFVEWDGGMVLTKTYVQEMTVEEVCNMVCKDLGVGFTLLSVSSEEELAM